MSEYSTSPGIAVAPASRRSSWASLVAATAGLGPVERLRVHVSVPETLELTGGFQRLVVQSYHRDDMDTGRGQLRRGARPLASAQRRVAREELQRGVRLDLVEVRSGGPGRDTIVVGWIEGGATDLELDGLRARPTGSRTLGWSAAPSMSDVIELQLDEPPLAA